MSSIRQRIFDALEARLADIVPANGYSTDAGARIHRGPVQVTEDETFPLVAVIPGDEDVGGQTEYDLLTIRLPVAVEALFAVDDPAQPFAALEPVLMDLKRAVFRQNDRTLGGLVTDLVYGGASPLDREEGGRHAGVRLRAVAAYRERYGAPDQA